MNSLGSWGIFISPVGWIIWSLSHWVKYHGCAKPRTWRPCGDNDTRDSQPGQPASPPRTCPLSPPSLHMEWVTRRLINDKSNKKALLLWRKALTWPSPSQMKGWASLRPRQASSPTRAARGPAEHGPKCVLFFYDLINSLFGAALGLKAALRGRSCVASGRASSPQWAGSSPRGLSRCGPGALGHRLRGWGPRASLLWGMGDLPGPGIYRVPCLGKQILIHWATKEFPKVDIFKRRQSDLGHRLWGP